MHIQLFSVAMQFHMKTLINLAKCGICKEYKVRWLLPLKKRTPIGFYFPGNVYYHHSA